MAKRPAAESESFFAAHGLAIDFAAAGRYASKRAKINSALLAAEERGDLDEVLLEADEFFSSLPKERGNVGDRDQEASMTTRGKIFISHTSHDAPLATLLKETLVLGGVPQERVFYSSERTTGIPAGRGVRQHLQETLQESSMVIELISETFISRPYCLMELGGAWVMEKPTYPLIVPPLTREEVVRKIGDVQLGLLGDDAAVDDVMNELHDGIASHAGLALTATAWGSAVRRLKTSFPEVVGKLAEEGAPPPPPSDRATRKDAAVEAELHGMTVTNTSVIETRHRTEVHGEATNSQGVRKTASLKATFYNSENRIIGVATGLASEVGPGETNSFTLSSMDPIGEYARYKMQFEAVL